MGSLTKKADMRSIFARRAAMANSNIAPLPSATREAKTRPLPRANVSAADFIEDQAKRQTNPRKKAQRKKMLRRDI